MLFSKPKNKSTSKEQFDHLRSLSSEATVLISPEVKPIINTAAATHIGTREYQQDAAYVSEPLYSEGVTYGVLCDGMGGTAEGERASNDVVTFIVNRINNIEAHDNIPAFLEQAAIDSNGFILEENARLGQNSGTTLLTAIICMDRLFWVSVGDSRIYIIRGDEIVQTTTDHNYALELQELVDAGRLTQEEADTDPQKEHLISYIGAPSLDRIDISRNPFQMQQGDIILLCSDGLTKALFPDEILDIINSCEDNIAEAARILPLTALEKSPAGADNITVILIRYQPD
ncbi:MAG: protein phosphatase 2C domain-containing protein [Oscillospiraceae bacterium]|jgi:protein phosphatase|nr:protein phosphatase 2C domain-containing protein [Oscillospiraceae bacterium]